MGIVGFPSKTSSRAAAYCSGQDLFLIKFGPINLHLPGRQSLRLALTHGNNDVGVGRATHARDRIATARPDGRDANDKKPMTSMFFAVACCSPRKSSSGRIRKAVALRGFFAGIGNRICFSNDLQRVLPPAANQQPTAFVGIVAFAMASRFSIRCCADSCSI